MRTILVIPQLGFTRNQQAIMRTAEAFGITEICLVGDRIFEFSSRITRGGHKHIGIKRFDTQEKCLNYLIGQRINLISIENCDESESIVDFEFPANIALIVGHERVGVPQEFLDNSIHLRIPQFGLMKCLNTSVSCGIVLYERFKQKLKI